MLICDFVSGNVNINDWSTLGEELPQEALIDFGIDITRVYCSLLVSLVK